MTTDPQQPAKNEQHSEQPFPGQQSVSSELMTSPDVMSQDAPAPQLKAPDVMAPDVMAPGSTGSAGNAAAASDHPHTDERASASGHSSDTVANTVEASQAEVSPTEVSPTEASQTAAAAPEMSRTSDIPAGTDPSASVTPGEPAATAAVRDVGSGISEVAAAAEGIAAADDEDPAVRIRDKMMAAADAQSKEAAVPATHREAAGGTRRVEIPGVDDLDASLEAEIQAVMEVTAAPVIAAAPADSTAESESAKPESAREVNPGSKVKGTVQQIHGDDVFLDAGLRTNVVVSLKQFGEGKTPEVGAQVDVIIEELDADGLIRGRLPKGRHKPAGNWDNLAVGQVIDCLVTAVNKGGLQVTVGGLRAFMPASQVELGFAGDLESYVGQKISAQVTEVNPKKRNLVVSRRALLQEERAETEGAFWTQAEVGQDFSGVVKTIKDYGAFINIGAVDGFLHIGEISWSRINHPSDVLAEGQTVDVKVLRLDPEKRRVSLGMKQLAQNPWSTASEKYATGRTVSGTVSRVTDFGAFVELEPGLEGMVHISELAWRRVGSVSEILNVGDSKDFQVQEVDTKRKRVSLSLKALEKRPESARPEQPSEPETPGEPRRPRNTNLRGGTSSDEASKKGGLFGNPSDFS